MRMSTLRVLNPEEHTSVSVNSDSNKYLIKYNVSFLRFLFNHSHIPKSFFVYILYQVIWQLI